MRWRGRKDEEENSGLEETKRECVKPADGIHRDANYC